MLTFQIEIADRESGETSLLTVRAPTRQHALLRASELGLVGQCVETLPAPPAPAQPEPGLAEGLLHDAEPNVAVVGFTNRSLRQLRGAVTQGVFWGLLWFTVAGFVLAVLAMLALTLLTAGAVTRAIGRPPASGAGPAPTWPSR
ncbi:MAG TPA: hypothetical protein VD963_09375 [Phycisphaerales bacterium]|nr:hypothetical protein [Phycisphaerales bacterium]